MPYIKQEARKKLDPHIDQLISQLSKKNVGEINYLFTRILLASKPESYDDYNALIGVLECCKLELYRRHTVPYEDKKIAANGDV